MASDTARLRYLMEEGPDGFVHVTKDRYEYAIEAAAEDGREEPNAADELEGFRRMIDCAMAGGDRSATKNTPNVESEGAARLLAQLPSTDGLGVAAPSAPTFGGREK